MVSGSAAHLPHLPQLGRLALDPFPVLDAGAFVTINSLKTVWSLIWRGGSWLIPEGTT